MRKQMERLMALVTVAWVLILSESYLFFYIIRPTAPNIHLSVASEVLKVGSVAALAGVWVVTLFSIEYFFFRPRPSEVLSRTKTSTKR